jgi:hypothetical protein
VRWTIENELASRLQLATSAAYTKADFGSPTGSTDVYELGLGLRYLLGPGLSAGIEYLLRHRTAMTSLPGYTRQIIGLRLRGQL